ncbi:MAG: aspartate--tRNA ligase [Verrucomicrobiae bacterium]|nr:aspartate--tRNA ligase [Verrucomicrobiae bacterium]
MKRTHHCNELRPTHIGQTVTLNGWVHSRRDLGGLIFIDVRDREGRTQTVFDPSDLPAALFERAAALRSECVVSLTGKVRQRPDGTNNPKIPTGEIEVAVQSLEVLNMADVLPFQIDDPEAAAKVAEDTRLQYRYLDLRRPEMAHHLRLRSKVAIATRQFMDEQGFLEVETPTLFKSTPEGAREFLVPNRREPGTFYALPQSPQQFKQILMVAGVEKYFQLARCYRDEDLRADRQPEFTQVDIEMSFIDREDIYALIEGLLARIWKTALAVDVPTPFPRISFAEALNRYGIDKPDTRFGLELVDFTEEFKASTFKVFSGAIANGGVVKALNAKGLAGATQGQIETMTEYAKSFGAKGLAFIKVERASGAAAASPKGDGSASAAGATEASQPPVEWKSPIVKFFSAAEKEALTRKLNIEEGDLILFAADQWLNACEILGKIRLYCADILKAQGKLVIDPKRFNFLWVIEFPLLGFDREQNRWYSSHHPFTAPVAEDIPLLQTDPKRVRGQHYDIVVNGIELGGGSIRIHQPEVQKTIFEELLQIPPDETKLRFGYMLEAFRYGAPPHGGIALGFDRLIAILCGTPSIRDVIAFPKTAKGTDLMTSSPSTVSPKQLRELYIEVKVKKPEVPAVSKA